MLLAFFPGRAAGEASYGSVVGIVTDLSGAVIPGAHATLTSSGVAATRNKQTSTTAAYRLLNWVPGPYQIRAESRGFKHFTRPSIDTQVASAARLEVTLSVGWSNDVGPGHHSISTGGANRPCSN